jgi:peptide/nickel transport system substrate-binding protein
VQDLDRARRLVRESGFSDGVTVRAIMTNVAPVPKVAATVGAELSEIGITLDLRGYDDPPWWPLIYLDTDWDVAFQGMGPRAHPDILFGREFMSGGSFNATGYRNTQLDALVVAARSAVTEVEQKRLYDEAQQIVRAEVPVLILYATDSLVGWKPGIRGFRPHPLGYWSLESVVRA